MQTGAFEGVETIGSRKEPSQDQSFADVVPSPGQPGKLHEDEGERDLAGSIHPEESAKTGGAHEMRGV